MFLEIWLPLVLVPLMLIGFVWVVQDEKRHDH